jgi:hypothetical protein
MLRGTNFLLFLVGGGAKVDFKSLISGFKGYSGCLAAGAETDAGLTLETSKTEEGAVDALESDELLAALKVEEDEMLRLEGVASCGVMPGNFRLAAAAFMGVRTGGWV